MRPLTTTTGFHLSKWYLDCIAPSGEVVIGYVADLGWSAISMRYVSVLEHREGKTRVTSSVRGFESPVEQDGTLTWSSTPLGVHGAWHGIVPAVEETILACDDGTVTWRCLQPASLVALRVANGDGASRAMSGLGYAEQLTLTLPPWRMPIEELHWGRFVSPLDDAGAHASLVWIDWRGPHAARFVFLDGVRVDADVTAERITLADGTTLSLDCADVLREGAIGTTVLKAIPELFRKAPGRVLGVHERKWRSRAVLERRGRAPAVGWAIHEVVRWP
jgi:hypothetical protein